MPIRMLNGTAKGECRHRSVAVLAFVLLMFVTLPNTSGAEDGSENHSAPGDCSRRSAKPASRHR